MTGYNDEMFTTLCVNVTPKTTSEQHLLVRSDKSVAYVTSNERLRSTFCTSEANYHRNSRGLFATAELLVRKVSSC